MSFTKFFFFFFSFFKKEKRSYSDNSYSFFNFIYAYFVSGNNSFLSLSASLWWVVTFLDINFWASCSKVLKKKKEVSAEKYTVTIKTYSNFFKKTKNAFKLIYLESLLQGSESNTLNKRLLLVFLDLFFNYKQSALYKKKVLVYKKLFK